MIIRYAKDKNGKPIGCVYAQNAAMIGWSLCCKRDIFSKKMARTIASGRAMNGTKKEVPGKLLAIYNEVYARLLEGK